MSGHLSSNPAGSIFVSAGFMKTIITLILIMITTTEQPRKVLLFYNDNGKQQWEAQLKTLEAAQKGIRERDIEVFSSPFSGQTADEWKKCKIDRSEAFTFILIGRDGSEKLRSHEIVKAEKLFGMIDAMPMRQREVSSDH